MNKLKTISLLPIEPKEIKKEIALLKKINTKFSLFGDFDKKDVEYTLERLRRRLP